MAEDLPNPEINISNFMITKGIFTDPSGSQYVPAGSVLWDTGNGATSFISEEFYRANKDFLTPMSEVEDSHISLADGKSALHITKKIRSTLTVRGVDDAIVNISSVFAVIPMPPSCSVILGFRDMIFEAPEMLVAMINRAAQHVKLGRAERERVRKERDAERKRLRAESQKPQPKAVHRAVQSAPGQPRRVLRLRPFHQPSDVDNIRAMGMGRLPELPRFRDDLYAINAISLLDGKTFDETLNDLSQSEEGQDVRPPWTQRDDLGPEEKESPYPGMFTDHLAFMEIPVEEARAEYLAEVAKPPAQPPPTTPIVDGVLPTDKTSPVKPAKRERFSNDMYNLPGFREYMETVAVDVFVPSNWQGISVPPIEFQWREDMPDIHRGKARPINPKRAEIVKKEFDRLCLYHLIKHNSSIVSPITDADKATAPFVRICGDYRWINTQILLDHEHIPLVRHELEKFSGYKYFIDLDMVNSFHQFRLAQKTSERLSVITPWGSYRPVFMPEGVSPATGVLQGHMRDMFKDFSDWAVVIFDNFCIGGDSMEDLFSKLKLFIARCKQYNLFLKMSKCYFGHQSVNFFGYEVDGEGWKIDNERKRAIKEIPFPSGPNAKFKIKRMQSFLGFSLYFRDFVDAYSTKAAQLYDMTTKTFDWREETWVLDYRSLFEKFKDDMCASFKLIFPDYSLPWILQPDAS